MDPEAMHSLGFMYYVGSYDLALILLDSVRAELAVARLQPQRRRRHGILCLWKLSLLV